MDDSIPSISSGTVGSRFISQNDVESARKKRDEAWKAAYARLGQEPPPQPTTEDAYDGRSLAEKLAANKAAKQEEWEERNRLANQFRALEEDEVMFLDTMREKREEEERERNLKDNEELKAFREAVAARESAANKAPPDTGAPTPVPGVKSPSPTGAANTGAIVKGKTKAPAPPAKNGKTSLKGVVVKKKAKRSVAPPTAPSDQSKQSKTEKKSQTEAETDLPPEPKRRRISGPDVSQP